MAGRFVRCVGRDRQSLQQQSEDIVALVKSPMLRAFRLVTDMVTALQHRCVSRFSLGTKGSLGTLVKCMQGQMQSSSEAKEGRKLEKGCRRQPHR